jgi:Protein of Unknown function (DUF2784)
MIHFAIVVGNCLSFLVLPFLTPIYVWLPILTTTANWAFAPSSYCPLTLLENRLRRHMGMPEIRDFMDHYIPL